MTAAVWPLSVTARQQGWAGLGLGDLSSSSSSSGSRYSWAGIMNPGLGLNSIPVPGCMGRDVGAGPG